MQSADGQRPICADSSHSGESDLNPLCSSRESAANLTSSIRAPKVGRCRFLIRAAQNGVHNVKSQVLYEIWRPFQQQGIRIPYPKRDLYVRSDAPVTFAEAGSRRQSGGKRR
jgi:small-conductance mechanosensitive channel